MKVVKNKVAAPFREAEFDILYGEGISREGDLLDLAVNNNMLEKSVSWFSYKSERIGQGRENARPVPEGQQGDAGEVELEVRKTLGLTRRAPLPQGRNRQRSVRSTCQTAKVATMPGGNGLRLRWRRLKR